MRIDWPSLAANPWFQFCALVAVLSGATTLYNLASHPQTIASGGGTPVPNPSPINVLTPTPAPVLQAKTRGQWIVDANGGAGSDSADLRAVVANLADGDTVTLRPGSYQGGFNITKSVRFVGQGANMSAADIHSSGRDTITVSGKNVSFENLTIGLDSSGDLLHALHCIGASHVELDRSLVGSKAKFGTLVSETASLDARDSFFQTAGTGCGLKYENFAHGNVQRCTFSSNRWGLEALNAAHVEATACTFYKNGLPNGTGSIIAINGGGARLDIIQGQFTSNPGAIFVSENGTLNMTDVLLKDNGITGEPGNSSVGLLCVQNGSKATLANITFEGNRQGISVLSGGAVTISGCHLANTGVRTDNTNLQRYSNAVSVAGQGSSVTIDKGTAITQSMANGIVVLQGARLTLDTASVEGSGEIGLLAGNNNGAASVEVRHGKFLQNQMGVEFYNGSSGTIEDCQLIGNAVAGISLVGMNTKATIDQCEFRGNKGAGLWIDGHAEGAVTGSIFDGNERGAQLGLPRKSDQSGTMTLDNCNITNSSICGIAVCTKSALFLRGVRFGNNHNSNISKERDTVVRSEDKYVR